METGNVVSGRKRSLSSSTSLTSIVGLILTGFIGQTLLQSIDLDESFKKLVSSTSLDVWILKYDQKGDAVKSSILGVMMAVLRVAEADS